MVRASSAARQQRPTPAIGNTGPAGSALRAVAERSGPQTFLHGAGTFAGDAALTGDAALGGDGAFTGGGKRPADRIRRAGRASL